MLFSRESGFYNPVFEGDLSTVIKSLQDRIVSHAQGGHILKDILSHLNSFHNCSFSHIGRQGNVVTHALAQRARLSYPQRSGWSLFFQISLLLYDSTFKSSFIDKLFSFSKKKKNCISHVQNSNNAKNGGTHLKKRRCLKSKNKIKN